MRSTFNEISEKELVAKFGVLVGLPRPCTLGVMRDCGSAQNSERITLQHSYHVTEISEMRLKFSELFRNASQMLSH